jgi:hypothetical protein
LNTLGGALSVETKSGITRGGTSLELSGGSFGRKVAELEHGGSNSKGFNWFLISFSTSEGMLFLSLFTDSL